jgi:hypothetical protein
MFEWRKKSFKSLSRKFLLLLHSQSDCSWIGKKCEFHKKAQFIVSIFLQYSTKVFFYQDNTRTNRFFENSSLTNNFNDEIKLLPMWVGVREKWIQNRKLFALKRKCSKSEQLISKKTFPFSVERYKNSEWMKPNRK